MTALIKQSDEALVTGGKSDAFLPQLLGAINQATEIDITVAFIRQSGLELIFDALKDAMDRRAVIRVLTSDYLDVTEPQALRRLIVITSYSIHYTKLYDTKQPILRNNRWGFLKDSSKWTDIQGAMLYCLTRSRLKTTKAWQVKEALRENLSAPLTVDDAETLTHLPASPIPRGGMRLVTHNSRIRQVT